MPGIVVFRRRWSVGSDDLVVPGVFLFTLHVIWAVVLGCVLGLTPLAQGPPCAHQLWLMLLVYMGLLAASLVLEIAISAVAMRGSILDTGARASMQYLLYARLAVMAVEIVWLVLGVLWLVHHYTECPAESAKDATLGLVICSWSVVLSVLLSMWCTFDAAGRSWVKMKEYQRSQREAEAHGRYQYKRSGSRHRNWRQRKVIRAYQDSWNHRCRLLFCCMGNSDRNRNSFADIARLLSDFFRDLDVVPSDVVAGLVLLRKFQKIERAAIVKERKNDTYEYLSGVPVTSQTQFLALNDPEHLAHFQAVIHYMHFALGAYGWPMFLMTHSGTGLCQLCARLRCACLPLGRRDEQPSVIVKDNCCQCNYAALRKMVEVGEVEVVYATYHVDVGETPFFVAVDYSRRKVVVSIRGTLSLQDVITDLNAEGEPLPVTPPREDWLGHKGMVQAAVYIRDKLRQERILERAFERDTARGTCSFELVLVGHSLGAGTATILAILLRPEQPALQCFAYSPPGGTLSMPAVEYTKSFITSVVLGKDVVPRIGLHQLESLRADLINTIKRSKDPKWKTIFCSVVCCGCAPLPTSAVELQASDVSDYQKQKEGARELSMHPSDSSIALTMHQPLYPPGRIIHIVRHHPTKGEQVLNKHEPVYQAVWANTTDFDEVLISPVMIQDHMPDNVLEALNKVITTVGPAKPQRAPSAPNSLVTSAEHLDSERCHLLAPASATSALPVVPCTATAAGAPELVQHHLPSPKATTPPHRLCLETSFTSLQSPCSDGRDPVSLTSSSGSGAQSYATGTSASVGARSANANGTASKVASPFALHPVLSWEYASILQDQLLASLQGVGSGGGGGVGGGVGGGANGGGGAIAHAHANTPPGPGQKVDLIHDDWFGLAPLATPESLSEVSSISSRASSLVLNLDRAWRERAATCRRSLLLAGESSGSLPLAGASDPDGSSPTGVAPARRAPPLGSAVAATLPATRRTPSGVPPLQDSSTDDLSFESARALSGGGGGGEGTATSSDAYVSVQGTPFSSADSVTVSADVHRWGTPSGAAVAAALDARRLSLSSSSTGSSERTERFDTPSSCCRACAMGVACENAMREARGARDNTWRPPPPPPPPRSTCHAASASASHPVFRTPSPLGAGVSVSTHTSPSDDNSHASNNNIKDYKVPALDTLLHGSDTSDVFGRSEAANTWKYGGQGFDARPENEPTFVDRNNAICNSNRSKTYFHPPVSNNLHTLESLPLLSNLEEVQEKTGYVQKYTYPITSVRKGESSV